MTQRHIPVEMDLNAIKRKKSLGAALELCAEFAELPLDKDLQLELKVDKGQFSRWQSGTEGIKWEKFAQLMDACGNDAPLFWMLHQRGYDLESIRPVETELERRLREAIEENKVWRRAAAAGVAA